MTSINRMLELARQARATNRPLLVSPAVFRVLQQMQHPDGTPIYEKDFNTFYGVEVVVTDD